MYGLGVSGEMANRRRRRHVPGARPGSGGPRRAAVRCDASFPVISRGCGRLAGPGRLRGAGRHLTVADWLRRAQCRRLTFLGDIGHGLWRRDSNGLCNVDVLAGELPPLFVGAPQIVGDRRIVGRGPSRCRWWGRRRSPLVAGGSPRCGRRGRSAAPVRVPAALPVLDYLVPLGAAGPDTGRGTRRWDTASIAGRWPQTVSAGTGVPAPPPRPAS